PLVGAEHTRARTLLRSADRLCCGGLSRHDGGRSIPAHRDRGERGRAQLRRALAPHDLAQSGAATGRAAAVALARDRRAGLRGLLRGTARPGREGSRAAACTLGVTTRRGLSPPSEPPPTDGWRGRRARARSGTSHCAWLGLAQVEQENFRTVRSCQCYGGLAAEGRALARLPPPALGPGPPPGPL